MKKTTTIIALICIHCYVHAQGIVFEKQLTWQQLQKKAKKENKYIFLDIYATWCGPCKMMDNSIYPVATVGNFFNKNFLSAKAQMDETINDTEMTKAWRIDSKEIYTKNKVNSFPTFLFLTPKGNTIRMASGLYRSPEEFIALAEKALDKNEQYFFLLDQYNQGKRDKPFIEDLLRLAELTADKKMIVRLKEPLK